MWGNEQAHVIADRPSLEVRNGVLHSSLVVFAHVLVHVWVVGTDVFFCAPVGHRAKLQRWVLLLGMLKLAEQREAREEDGRGMRHTRLCTNLSDLFLSTFQTNLQHSVHSQIFEKRAVCGLKVAFRTVFYVFKNCGNGVMLNEILFIPKFLCFNQFNIQMHRIWLTLRL